MQDPGEEIAQYSADGERQYPGGHDIAGYSPPHRRKTGRRADSHYGGADTVRRADRNAKIRGNFNNGGRRRRRGETMYLAEVGDPHTDRPNHPPAAYSRPGADRQCRDDDDPPGISVQQWEPVP